MNHFDLIYPRALHNVLIDFLNRDNREIFGLFSNLEEQAHAQVLSEALNIAVLLCDKFCVTSPGPIAECGVAQEALRRRSEYLTEKVIRFPLRESSIDDFLGKKGRQYGRHSSIYKNLFLPASDRFLKKYSNAIIPRKTSIGKFIAGRWEAGPDTDPIWEPLVRGAIIKDVQDIRRIGVLLTSMDHAVNWPNIRELLSTQWKKSEAEIRGILQHYYFQAYLEEYQLRAITNLPFTRANFGTSNVDLGYDYETLREALFACGSWGAILKMSASSILRLRSRLGYFRMRTTFDRIAANSLSSREVAEFFAVGAFQCRQIMHQTHIVEEMAQKNIVPVEGLDWSESEIDALEERWLALCDKLDKLDFQAPENNAVDLKNKIVTPALGRKIVMVNLPISTGPNTIIYNMNNNINVGGNAILNINSILSEVNQSISGASDFSSEKKDALRELVLNLQKGIDSIKSNHPSEASLIADNLKTVVNAATVPAANRNKKILEISKKGLLDAAETVAKIAPEVLATAKLIGDFIMNR